MMRRGFVGLASSLGVALLMGCSSSYSNPPRQKISEWLDNYLDCLARGDVRALAALLHRTDSRELAVQHMTQRGHRKWFIQDGLDVGVSTMVPDVFLGVGPEPPEVPASIRLGSIDSPQPRSDATHPVWNFQLLWLKDEHQFTFKRELSKS